MGLYHLSDNINLSHLEPRVPDTIIPEYEDCKTPRVCFSTSIYGAIQSINPILSPIIETYMCIYVPVNFDINLVYQPTQAEVPDVILTNERWYLGPIDVKQIGIVRINNDKRIGQFVSEINDHYNFYVYEYDYDLYLYKNGDERMRG